MIAYISGVKMVSLYLMELIFLMCRVTFFILIELAKAKKGSILVLLVMLPVILERCSGSGQIC